MFRRVTAEIRVTYLQNQRGCSALGLFFLNVRITWFVYPETAVFSLVEKSTLLKHFSVSVFISLNQRPYPTSACSFGENTVSLCSVWPMCSGFLTAKGQDSEKCVCSESGGEQGILLQGHWDVGFKRVALPIKIIRFIYISTDKTSLWGERNMRKRTDKQAEKSDCWKGWWVEQTADCSCNKVLEESGSSGEWLRGQRHHL